MAPQSGVNVGFVIPEEVIDEMIPGRGALVPTASSAITVRNIWIDVLRSNTLPVADSSRLKVTPGSEGGAGLAIVHFSLPGRAQFLNRAEGDELDISSEHFVLLYRRGDEQTSSSETTTYVLWRDIQYIEFARRAR